jgi:hypothetical protein
MNIRDYVLREKEINTELLEASMLDLDELIDDSDKKVMDQVADKLFNEYPINEPGKDAYGRKLEVGDWVMCVPTGQKSLAAMTFGIIKRMSAKRITISIKSNAKQAGWKSVRNSPHRFAEATMDISVDPKFVFKIMDKQEFADTL